MREVGAPDLPNERLIPIPDTYVVHSGDSADLIGDIFPHVSNLRGENAVIRVILKPMKEAEVQINAMLLDKIGQPAHANG